MLWLFLKEAYNQNLGFMLIKILKNLKTEKRGRNYSVHQIYTIFFSHVNIDLHDVGPIFTCEEGVVHWCIKFHAKRG